MTQQIILLASATSRFRELDDVSEPFFEMFRVVGLEPLDTDECGRLWEVVSGKRASRSEVRPIQILTGGNPRLLVMAAEFARHRSLRRLMSELVTMIDEHTEYFRGHLVERGAVIRQGRGRKRLYSAAEPLYSMYYKLRRERDEAAVVENLIRFMVACYGVGDLAEPWVDWVTWRAEGARSLALAVQENHRAALASFQAAYVVFSTDDDVTMRQMLDLVTSLVARGGAPQDLLAILASDTAKAASLHPLIVALHQQAGDRVRAPREVAEVANDIRERFHKAEERKDDTPSG